MAAPAFDRRPHRPRSVTLLGWGVLLLGFANVWRAAELLQQSPMLRQLEVTPDPRLRAVLAGLWALLFLAAAVALWRRLRPARIAVPALLGTYGLYSIGLPALFARDDLSTDNLALAAAAYGVAVAFAAWALNRTAAGAYFRPTGAHS